MLTLHLRYPIPCDENLVRALYEARAVKLPARQVPGDFFLVEVDGEMVGRVCIRHRHKEYLVNFGGHGIDQALTNGQNENRISARDIEKGGRVLEDVRFEHWAAACQSKD